MSIYNDDPTYFSCREVSIFLGRNHELYYLEYNPITKTWAVYEAPNDLIWLSESSKKKRN